MKIPSPRSLLAGAWRAGLVLALAVSARAAVAQTVISSYAADYSSVQSENGWSYRYTTPSNRFGDPLAASLMSLSGSNWYVGSAGGDRAQISGSGMFQRVANDPLVVYTFAESYGSVSVNLNGLTVNANGEGYVGYWSASTSTWTTLLTLSGGTTYSQSITLTGVEAGDSLVFGKKAGVGTNYGQITSFAPILSLAAVPEPGAAGLVLGASAAVAACALRRSRAGNR